MTTVVFSDTHLTDQYDAETFHALRTIIEPADQVIINGDFWDGYLTDFDSFLSSPWKDELFPLLKSKQTIYIPGNHDEPSFMDERTSEFARHIVPLFVLKSPAHTYLIQHGHVIYKNTVILVSDRIPRIVSATFFRFLTDQEKKQSWLGKLSKIIAHSLDVYDHERMKAYVRTARGKENLTFIFGHTHIPYVSKKKDHFNSGSFTPKKFSYLVIDSEGCQLLTIE